MVKKERILILENGVFDLSNLGETHSHTARSFHGLVMQTLPLYFQIRQVQ
jgi:hypothetical protein